MNTPETYDYLVRARRDLWATLEGVPDEVLSRSLLRRLAQTLGGVRPFSLRKASLRHYA